MGTNFYWKTDFQETILPTGEKYTLDYDDMDPRFHIGKRSAAGRYCWHCRVTLCKGGVDAIHFGRSEWHSRCPVCGASPVDEGLQSGPAAVELGFAKPYQELPQDVRGAASFTWAQESSIVRAICEKNLDEPIIIDEYDRYLTGREFLNMLANNCPIEFMHIGGWFC